MNIEQEYQEAVARLNSDYTAFHQSGANAYHPGLDTIKYLDKWLGNASSKYPTIHVGGTNGKGSTSSLIASVLTSAGYKTGLYTSPHLVDFRERIRVNGLMVNKEFVVDFMRMAQQIPSERHPSYFELVTAMAFAYFAECNVDVAIIEVGLGGRLDSTNIITPLISVITNISKDHTAILGTTEPEIAKEKAGIIKQNRPVVIGNAENREVRAIFSDEAHRQNAPIIFAAENKLYGKVSETQLSAIYSETPWGEITSPLIGNCQHENAATVFNSLVALSEHFDISPSAVSNGFANVATLSGLMGRFMPIRYCGYDFICDTGHNAGAWQHIGPQLSALSANRKLRLVLGFVADKNIEDIISYMPTAADYYFVAPPSDRARSAADTAKAFASQGIEGQIFDDVESGVAAAIEDSATDDIIFVGGSNFVAAPFLAVVQGQKL